METTNNANTMRKKEYYTSKELPHIFAHRGAPKGRCPSAQTFSGDNYFSYSTCIAKLITGKNGAQGVILNHTRYSVTTSAHQGAVCNAASHIENKFYAGGVNRGGCGIERWDGKQLVAHYIAEFESLLKDPEGYERTPGNPYGNITSKPSRYAHKRALRFLNAIHALDKAIRASEFFGLACKALKTKLAKFQPKIDEANTEIATYDQKKEKRKHERQAETVKRHVATARKWLADDSDLRTISVGDIADSEPELYNQVAAKNCKLESEKIENWKAGKDVYLTSFGLPTLLRREGEEIVTSLGARIPIEHARRAFAIVLKIRQRGVEFISNGRTIHVGIYQIESVSKDGDIVAGCHRISWEEIEDLAKRENFGNQFSNEVKEFVAEQHA